MSHTFLENLLKGEFHISNKAHIPVNFDLFPTLNYKMVCCLLSVTAGLPIVLGQNLLESNFREVTCSRLRSCGLSAFLLSASLIISYS